MKKSVISVITLAIMSTATMVGTTYAADAVLGVDVNSAYVWRGITFNDGLVIQPSLDVTKGGFNINVWGNVDIDDYNDTLDDGEFSEVDLTLSYSHSINTIDLSAGLIEYLFPNGGQGTAEVFASGTVNLPAGFSFGLNINYDIDEVDDYYISAGPGYSYSINDKTSIDASVVAGYAGKDMSAGSESGFHDITASISGSYAMTEAIGIGANLYYTDTLDKDVLPEQDVDVYGGISLTYNF